MISVIEIGWHKVGESVKDFRKSSSIIGDTNEYIRAKHHGLKSYLVQSDQCKWMWRKDVQRMNLYWQRGIFILTSMRFMLRKHSHVEQPVGISLFCLPMLFV